MGAQRGKDLLLKIKKEDNQGFITIGGLRSKKIAFNSHIVDITDQDSQGRWRHLLDGCSIHRASIAGNGIFKDVDSDSKIRGYFFSGYIPDWEMQIPNFGSIQGPFQITSLEYSGNYDGEIHFEISLESAGLIQFKED